jgi:hypothetical protein
MNLSDFISKFPDESSCKDHWRQKREKQGVICKNCNCTENRWVPSLEMWECKKCRYRTSLKSGTIMENSNLPIKDWYLAIHLLTSTKKSFSSKELQRQLGRKRYEPVLAMRHKIMNAMGLRDDLYVLKEQVELDDAFFETFENKTKEEIEKEHKSKEDEKLKRGRGSQRQGKVVVMVESVEIEEDKNNNKYSKPKKIRYIKMDLVENLKKKTINEITQKKIDTTSKIVTDKSTSYVDFKNNFAEHKSVISKYPEAKTEDLVWIHTIISNAKRLILGVYHSVGKGYLQNYLNEFCYKLNRRYFGKNIFDRLIIASITTQHYKVQQIRYNWKNG